MNAFIFYFFLFILGLIIGSFLNAVIWRLHREESLWRQLRSYCTKCEHPLAIYDLIPLLSFGVLKGKCRYCRKRISWQYPLVELATGILFVLVGTRYQIPDTRYLIWDYRLLFVIRDWIFASFLIVIFVYDWRYYLIIDKVTIPGIVVALVFNLILGVALWKLLLAAAIGGGFFLLQIIISKGKWVGGGDVRLGVLMGLMVSWPGILVALFIAYVSGAAVGLALIAAKTKTMKSQIPFGTFLSLATVITLLYGEEILKWYLGLLG